MSENEGHEVNRWHFPQNSTDTADFIKFFYGIDQAIRRMQNEGQGMPAVAGQLRGGGVIAGYDQHVGVERPHLRNVAVYFLNHLDLAIEIPIFSARVRLLDVQEKEIILRKMICQRLKLLFQAADA